MIRKIVHTNGLKSPLFLIISGGFILRILFLQVLAPFYFGRENIYVDGDTYAWCWAFQNLLETGEFTVNPGLEYGYFGRMPGYSFFVGIFYLICGQSWEAAFPVIAWTQLALDTFAIWLVYSIMHKISGLRSAALIAAILYASYPFIIVWIPLVYSEQSSIFFMLLAIWLLLKPKPYSGFLGAAALGFAALLRPQMLLIAPFLLVYATFKEPLNRKFMLRKALLLGVGFMLVYAPWPVRNYVNHGKFIPTQDLRGFYNWNTDVMAFMGYIYTVKPEWEPQYSQIIQNKKVIFPDIAYLSEEDSLKLDKAARMCQECGSGFSHKSGYWKKPFDEPNCNAEIVHLFNEQRLKMIQQHPFHVYVAVPLMNLKKALFKSRLTDDASLARKLASLLFFYRTLLIIAGWIALLVLFKRSDTRNKSFYAVIALFFLAFYILLCAGTMPQLRNIEMRYFLQADILLLFPLAHLVALYFEYMTSKALTKKGRAGIL